ncbi:MAG: hypothetical protein COC24_002170 [Alphaproteobacteria bacterium]|nr:hypothetical protein [Alphaproteobacteria bacterium]
MNSVAPGQMFGYMLQFPRALLRLLQAKKGECVSIEVFSDVAVVDADGNIISEEDKSSLKINPVTNRSENLWKTFANWIDDVNSGKLDINKTKFVLYANREGKAALVDLFSAAKDITAAKAAILEAKSELSDLDEGHNAWPYYNKSINENEDLFEKIIQSFDFELGSSDGFEEIHEELYRKTIHESLHDFLTKSLLGWLFYNVEKKISDGRDAVISQEEFYSNYVAYFERVRARELIDFASKINFSKEDLERNVNESPIYIKQLDAINISSDGLMEAVLDFLSADVNRSKWIEQEIIDLDVASEFENDLSRFWANARDKTNITRREESDENKGKLLLIECQTRKQRIRNMDPPSSTVSGTYHALANEPSLGWHPQWLEKFEKEDS